MDVEKTIQFLLEQQARFDTHQAQFEQGIAQIRTVLLDVATAQQNTNAILTALTERPIELEQRHQTLSLARRDTGQNLSALAEAQGETGQNLSALSEAQRETERNLSALAEAQRETEKSLSALSEAQRETEKNLNALIATLDHHIEGHN
jgi:DNA repair ATPase RecN